jgi:microcystin-dependent protein
MAQPYVGEIRLFAGAFAPAGWLSCEGQILPISENEPLFQLLDTTYGGDGQETFGLPDLRGRVPVHQGTGPGMLQTYVRGESFGVEEVTLTSQHLPNHSHPLMTSTGGGAQSAPEGALLAAPPTTARYTRATPDQPLGSASVVPIGGSQPHDNRIPSLTIRYIISLFGIFPSPT